MSITAKLDELFKEWIASNPSYKDSFVKDGVVNETEWSDSECKILILLKERNKDTGDIRESINQEKQGVWPEVGEWSFGIHKTLLTEIPDFKDAKDGRDKFRKMVAVMNLKKTPGGGSANEEEIREAARKDWDFICREIAIIDPKIIICGGTFNFFRELCSEWEIRELGNGGNRAYKFGDRVVIDFVHPSYRVRSDMKFYYLCAIYQKVLNILHKQGLSLC